MRKKKKTQKKEENQEKISLEWESNDKVLNNYY